MRVVTERLSPKLTKLLEAWLKEEEFNHEHDLAGNEAWNRLVEHLMQLEGGTYDRPREGKPDPGISGG